MRSKKRSAGHVLAAATQIPAVTPRVTRMMSGVRRSASTLWPCYIDPLLSKPNNGINGLCPWINAYRRRFFLLNLSPSG